MNWGIYGSEFYRQVEETYKASQLNEQRTTQILTELEKIKEELEELKKKIDEK